MSPTDTEDAVSSIFIRNPRSQDMVLYVEPWGDELTLSPGVTGVQVRGPKDNSLEIEFPEKGVIIYAWSGTVLTVFNGEHVVRDYPIRVPPVPNSAGRESGS